ncbi:threonine/homoserine efflux transporter RhtA [Actinophytocola algeriensis]|uniref:Threonine/homoserine efflux transporter RhtA n=1 Tax=Actinophytocola algeriensis TaxID=1768010 RepID=A0A7W7VC93_9PSEU|nr:threonine/homoserine efflux transporter RhtA [Actinophytocola algeriensis]MBE1476222.1 threonine/homoserine efflux transporter RhtA [Actinophytocola algeriensis]
MTATVIGLLVLRQVPSLPEALGILAVVLGLTMRTRERQPGTAPL